MAKRKQLDPRVEQMVASFNRKPTDAEQAEFHRRNAGGPVSCYPSLTRGRGISGNYGAFDWHLGDYRVAMSRMEMYGHWAGPPWQQAHQAMFYDDSGD